MKRNLWYLLILIILTTAALLLRKQWGTLSVDETAFAIEDTAAIGKIFIADMQGGKVILTRNNQYWTVNDKYIVRNDYMPTLLSTLKNLSVDRPVPDAAQANVLKEMASHNKRVEVFDRKGKLLKAYFVGGSSLDALGTYMVMDKAKKAYVMVIPGFMGVLQTRYSTDEEEIRSPTIYQSRINEIKELQVDYPQQSDSSFTITVFAPDSFEVKNRKNKTLHRKEYDQSKLVAYLNNFKFVSAEAFVNKLPKKDTIVQTIPYCIITLTDKNNQSSQTVVYLMPRTQRTVIQRDSQGNLVQYDNDRYFATINNGSDFVIIQHFHFGRIFKSYRYFTSSIMN